MTHFLFTARANAACGAKPWPSGNFSTNRRHVDCYECGQLADAVRWDGETQAHVAICQGCDCIVAGGISDGRFSPFRGRVVNGEVWCVTCYNAKAAALAVLGTIPC